MRFLLLSGSFSKSSAQAGMIQQLAESLSRAGHRADIICLNTRGQISYGPHESDSEIRAFALPPGSRVTPSTGPFHQAPNAWRLHLDRHLTRWLEGPYDAALLTTPAIISAGIFTRLKKSGVVSRIGLILWDFFPVANLEGGVRIGALARPALALERRIAQTADVIFPMSPAGYDYSRIYYRTRTRSVILPPWGSVVPVPPSNRFKRFTCAWGGQLTGLRGINDLVATAALLQHQSPDVRIRIAGDGPLRDRAERECAERHLLNTQFVGRLARSEYIALLSSCHLALTLVDSASTSPNFPSKTVDYCQAGLPVVGAVQPGNDYGQIIEEAGFGLAVPAGDAAAVARAIAQVASLPDVERTAMSNASRAFFESHLSAESAACVILRTFMQPGSGIRPVAAAQP